MSKHQYHPPKWATKFLDWFCSEELIEEIHGDLQEAYSYRRGLHGKLRADLWYISDVIKFFKPYSFEKYSRSKQFMPMFNSYVKISFRNILKQTYISIINILGLSVGIATVALIMLYVHHETSYDRSFPESENIYRVINHYRDQTYTCLELPNGRESSLEESTRVVRFLSENDEVIEACQFVPDWSAMGPAAKTYLYVDGREFARNDFLYTNTGLSFQSIFPQTFLIGNPRTAFTNFQSIILTESVAETFYGFDWETKDLLDKEIEMNDMLFRVGGVIEDAPSNIHFNFGMIVHQQSLPSWAAYTYFKVRHGADPENVLERLNAGVNQIYPDYYDDGLAKGLDIVSLHDIHFTGGMLYEMKAIANVEYLLVFSIFGIVILLIIWTNYTNLSIAIYANRQKELGVRKIMGARGRDVSSQIVIEGILTAVLCFPIIWALTSVALPSLNRLLNISISSSALFDLTNLLILFILLVATGIIGSLYPAMVFGGKSLVRLFQGKLSRKGRSISHLRRALLTLQFLMLIVLMSLALIIMKQLKYVQDKELGYEKEGIIYFDLEGREKYYQLKEIIESYPEVISIGNGMIPGANMYNQITYKLMGTEEVMADGTHIYGSMSGLELLGIKSEAFNLIKQGQDSVFIINRTAAEKIAAIKGVKPEDLVGEIIVMEPEWENETWGYGIHYGIAGIIDDFDYFSLKYESQSLLMEVHEDPPWIYNMILKVNTDNWSDALAKVEEAYKQVEKDIPLSVNFLDQRIDQLYENERDAGGIATFLTLICIFLSVAGLIGIVGFVTQTRQKEIGVRKVFGASVPQILTFACKEYVIMLAIATVVAVPVAIYLANQWLESFAYRISPGFPIVMLSGILTLVIVISVVVIQSFKSANMNPADTLRYE